MTEAANSILIVDDQIDNLRTLSALLTGEGYRVRKALSGRMALETVAVEPPDLILLDVFMPEMNGYQVCQHLKADPRSAAIPILFLSALDHLDDKLQAFSVGGADYITKPFAAEEVLARIRHQMQILQQQRSLLREVAERRQVETTLERQNQTLKAIFQTVPDQILRLQMDGTLLDDLSRNHTTNPAVWPKAVWELLRGAIDQALQQNRVVAVEYQLDHAGVHRYYEARVTAFRATEVLVVIRDVTHARQMELDAIRQAGRQQLLASINDQIHRATQVQDILMAAVTGARRLLQVNRVVIYRFHADWSGAVTVEAVDDPALSIQGQSISDPCLQDGWHHRYQRGVLQAIPDIQTATELSPCYRQMMADIQVRATLVVPICLQQRADSPLWGLLIAHHCQAPRGWDVWEQDLMQQLAAQLAVALHRADLYEMTCRQARQARLLNRILDAVRESLELDTILHRAASAIREAFEASCSIIALCQEDDTVLHHRVTATVTGTRNTYGQVTPLVDNAQAQALLASTAPIAIAEVVSDSEPVPILTPGDGQVVHAVLAIAIRFEGKAQGILCVQQFDGPRQWRDDEQALLTSVANHLALALQQAQLYQQLQDAYQTLERLAHLDGLTQVPNRRRLDDYLDQIWRQLRRERQPISLILCDVDYFKRYNDTYGHLQGDECLQRVARLLTQVIQRPADLVARYGGEEFAVILPRTPAQGATYVAQRIQSAIAAEAIPHPDSPLGETVTLSLGVATHTPTADVSAERLLAKADAALYAAKRQGRNRVVSWAEAYQAAPHNSP